MALNSRTQPIERGNEKKYQKNEVRKKRIIDKFIENSPKILQLNMESSPTV
jgi:hypothetical protein